VTKFVYTLNGEAEIDVPGDETATSVTITGLTAGTQYSINIAAANAYGTGAFLGSAVTQYSAPAPPTGVTIADNAETSKFDISWTASASATSYVILWSDGTNFNEETYQSDDSDACLTDTSYSCTFSKSTFLASTGISEGTTIQVKVRALHTTNSGTVGTDSDQSSGTVLIA
jgi:hypothetical protein